MAGNKDLERRKHIIRQALFAYYFSGSAEKAVQSLAEVGYKCSTKTIYRWHNTQKDIAALAKADADFQLGQKLQAIVLLSADRMIKKLEGPEDIDVSDLNRVMGTALDKKFTLTGKQPLQTGKVKLIWEDANALSANQLNTGEH